MSVLTMFFLLLFLQHWCFCVFLNVRRLKRRSWSCDFSFFFLLEIYWSAWRRHCKTCLNPFNTSSQWRAVKLLKFRVEIGIPCGIGGLEILPSLQSFKLLGLTCRIYRSKTLCPLRICWSWFDSSTGVSFCLHLECIRWSEQCVTGWYTKEMRRGKMSISTLTLKCNIRFRIQDPQTLIGNYKRRCSSVVK